MSKLILASTSPFRQSILRKLQIEFDVEAPQVDETRLPDEPPEQMVTRLAVAKARAVATIHTNALIIGSDQVATYEQQILGKPHTHDKAVKQLRMLSGHKVTFFTGLCLYNSASSQQQVACVPYTVYFRQLTDEQIERYLRIEQPYNCAGSFKSEGLGVSLFEKLQGDDPNTLVGLPLIELIRMLGNEGIVIP